MKGIKHLILLLALLWGSQNLQGQVELKLQLQPDGKTYTLLARSAADFLPPLDNLTHSAQITLVVPTGSFQPGSLENHAGLWEMTHLLLHPSENPGADYLVFNLLNATTGIVYPQGQEVPFFSFQNALPDCGGAFEIMDNETDPFAPPNSLNMQVGNEMVVEGAGTGENAYLGNYDPGSANCLWFSGCPVAYELELLPGGYYQLSLLPDAAMLPPLEPVSALKMTVKVPAGFFKVHDLTNLQPATLDFGSVLRFDAPIEAPGFDYILFQLHASGSLGLSLQPGVKVPLLKFANEGSCQGDSIFLVNNTDDPFMPPNSQGAAIGQSLMLQGTGTPYLGVCPGENHSAPCLGCQFVPDNISIDSLTSADPIACLGNGNGILRMFAHGLSPLYFSIDGGASWSLNGNFEGLPPGTYEPAVRGDYYGCNTEKYAPPIELTASTEFSLLLDAPEKVCAGEDFGLKVMAPQPLPADAAFAWAGPNGFTANIPDPAVFNANLFQSGNYTLTVTAPGCDPASAMVPVQVVVPVEEPALTGTPSLCDGDTLWLGTATAGAKYEWIGPAGQAPVTLDLPGLTTNEGNTFILKNNPAYLGGAWRVRVTDGNGCVVESPALNVNIKPRPQAFATNDGPVCQGDPATLFSNPMPGAGYRWQEAGTTSVFSEQPNPQLANVTTQKTYYLTVVKDGCTSENISLTTVSLHPKPSLNPTTGYSVAADCSPEDLAFTANASGVGISFDWSGPNGFVSHLENPVIPNANATHNGSYQLEVTNTWGCKASEAFLVNNVVDAVEMPLIQATPAVCPGETIALEVQPYSGFDVIYQWRKNGNPIFGENISQLYLTDVDSLDEGAYDVVVQVDACELQSDAFLVDVLKKPVATPDFFLSQPCEGGTLQFFSNTAGIAGWEWSGPNGFYSQSSNPLIYDTEFSDIGAYTLTVTGTNGCVATSGIVVDGILPVPAAPQAVSNSPVCPEDSIVLQVQNPLTTGTVSFEWLNGGGVTLPNLESTLTLAAGAPLAVPPFFVKTYLNGCASALSAPIPVEVKPAPMAMASNSGPICPGETAQLFAAPIPNGEYEWRIAGETQVLSFDQNPVLTLSNTTLFELTAKTYGCETESVTTTAVPVFTAPEIGSIAGNATYCSGSTAILNATNSAPLNAPLTFNWTGPNGFSYTGTGNPGGAYPVTIQNVSMTDQGTYTLTLMSAEGCPSEPASVLLDVVATPDAPVLVASDDVLCQGETLELNTSGYASNNVNYEWYFDDGTMTWLIGETNAPTFFLPSAMPSNTGIYSVVAEVESCFTSSSNLEAVTVLGIATIIVAENTTTATLPACEGGEVEISVPYIPGATYDWYGPGGFASNVANPVLTDVQASQSGSYFVVVGLPGCASVTTASTMVYIDEMPPVPLLSGPSNICEGKDITISVANVHPGASYDIYFGQSLLSSGVPFINFNDVLPSQTGVFTAIAHLGGCTSEPSAPISLTVDFIPAEDAFAGDDQFLCPDEVVVNLAATPPAAGTGFWAASNGATLADPGQPNTGAFDLAAGQNTFIWTLSNGACADYSADTMQVFYKTPVQAEADAFMVPTDGSLTNANLLVNDAFGNAGSWEFFIFKNPQKGSLQNNGDGTVSYQAFPHTFGTDELIYRLCSAECPDQCDTALVTFTFEGPANPVDCFVPNLVTPNGDGENDTFVVPCVAEYPGSKLAVFNRWGNMIFETNNYNNDWDGSYNGQPLPDGTYFFQLTLNDADRTTLNGYVVVMR
jgi:gliding motility-associated-like protein